MSDQKKQVAFKEYVRSVRTRIVGDGPDESGTNTAFIIALMALAINSIMILKLIIDFAFGGRNSQTPGTSELIDHALILCVVSITYFFMFNKIAQLRNRKNEIGGKYDELKKKSDQLPIVVSHIHRFNHILRNCVELIDIGFRYEDESSGNSDNITPMDIRRRTSEYLHLALTEAACAFEAMTNGKCAVALKSLGTRDGEQVVVTVARDMKTQADREEYDKLARTHNCDHYDKNSHYQKLFKSKRPWLIKFDSRDDLNRKSLGAASNAVWTLYDSGYCPESQIYCSTSQDKTLIPHYDQFNARGVKLSFVTNGVLYIDCEHKHAFNAEHTELAHAFADALFKVCEYRLKFMLSHKAAQKKKKKTGQSKASLIPNLSTDSDN